MKKFHPSKIRRLVFDLDSITVNFEKTDWENFRKILQILDNRDFDTFLISKNFDSTNLGTYSRLSVIQSTCEEAFQKNASLLESDVFWFSESSSLQKNLSNSTRNFAGSNSLTLNYGGLQYQSLYDILQIFHPSRITAEDLSKDILKLKLSSEKAPFIIGIGGPEDCGHSFFVGELLEMLEDKEMLVSSIDLSQVLGTEFTKNHKKKEKNYFSLWNSNEIRDWLIEDVISPYYNGKQVYIEDSPQILKDQDLTIFPFFLDPEMILIIWGSTIFIPDLEKYFDLKILLELSEKCAAARLFGIDERQNFDHSFIDTYLKKEGKHYNEYLKRNNVKKTIDYRIDFNNFYSFRIK